MKIVLECGEYVVCIESSFKTMHLLLPLIMVLKG